MFRIVLVLGFLVALVGSAAAGPWPGGTVSAPASSAQFEIQKVDCFHNDYYCPYGRYRYCTNGYCGCALCRREYYRRDPYYRYEPPAPPPGLLFNFNLGGGNDNRQYYPPNVFRYGGNGCQRGYSVQDGLCKPYRGY